MAVGDLEEGAVGILKETICVTAFRPTVQHILLGVKCSFYFQN